MKMRSMLLAAALTAVAAAPVPAMARDRQMGEAMAQLNDPAFQHSLSSALGAMMQAMMGIKMAPFANAMKTMGDKMGDPDAGRDIDPDATFGDMMGPEGRDMPREMTEKLPAMMSGMAGMAGAMEQMIPEFEKIGKELRKSLPRSFPRH